MENKILNINLSAIFFAFLIISTTAFSASAGAVDIYSGHFARAGNNQSPSATSKSNIYIKLFENQWVAMLYVPYPYAKTVPAPVINKVFQQAKTLTTGSAYLRGDFGQLEELATVQIEKFGYLDDRLIFECGALSPCTIKLHDSYLELIKPGVINEHIIKYDHVADQE